jgi:hypothetical protein
MSMSTGWKDIMIVRPHVCKFHPHEASYKRTERLWGYDGLKRRISIARAIDEGS